MSESKNREAAEQHEDSAKVILANVREQLNIPSEAKIVAFIEKNYTPNKNIVLAMAHLGEKDVGIMITNQTSDALKIAKHDINVALDERLHYLRMQAMKEAQVGKIITPGENKPEGGIIT